jgi:predicted nucleotidyltransferase
VSLAVFGSFATGQQTDASDVDVLVELAQPLGLEFVGACMGIEEILGRKADVVRPELLKPRLKSRALREQVDVWRA